MRLLLTTTVLMTLGLVSASAQLLDVDIWGGEPVTESVTPSWYGNTGLILVPSAQTGPLLKLTGGFHRIDTDVQDQDVYNINVALTKDLEVGAARLKGIPQRTPSVLDYTDETVFSAKYQLDLMGLFGLMGGPDLAIGVWDAADQVNRAIYVVATKSLELAGPLSRITVHAGFGATEHQGGAFDGLFGGLEFVPFRGALAQVEYDADAFNVCLRYYPTEWFSLDVGSLDGDFAWGASARTVF